MQAVAKLFQPFTQNKKSMTVIMVWSSFEDLIHLHFSKDYWTVHTVKDAMGS